MKVWLLTVFALAAAVQAQAQEANVSSSSSTTSMADLIKQGYEIRTSSQSGSKIIVFLQKDKTAYACEFTSLTRSRCGSIN